MTKVYEASSGRKPSGFTLYPRWQCPRCKTWCSEPMFKICHACRSAEEQQSSS